MLDAGGVMLDRLTEKTIERQFYLVVIRQSTNKREHSTERKIIIMDHSFFNQLYKKDQEQIQMC